MATLGGAKYQVQLKYGNGDDRKTKTFSGLNFASVGGGLSSTLGVNADNVYDFFTAVNDSILGSDSGTYEISIIETRPIEGGGNNG